MDSRANQRGIDLVFKRKKRYNVEKDFSAAALHPSLELKYLCFFKFCLSRFSFVAPPLTVTFQLYFHTLTSFSSFGLKS